jgi:hypothetical protein
MGQWHTRQELYDIAWAEPVSKVARRYGISDVAFRKICSRVQIPIPERGYWAKLRFGKEVKRTPLPPREPGMSEKVHVGPLRHSWYRRDEDPSEPFKEGEPPEFPDDIGELALSVRGRAGNPRVPRLERRKHPVVARLLEEDEQRRVALADRARHTYGLRQPRFGSPSDRRGLRIANALFLTLERLGAKPDVRDRGELELGATVGGTWVPISIDLVSKDKTRGRVSSKPLVRVSVPVRGIPGCETGVWSESRQSIERQIGEIAAGIIVAGELLYREHQTKWYEQWLESKRRLEEFERERHLEEERRERERQRAEQHARVDQLLAEVEQFRRAADIRAYVNAARHANRESSVPVPDDTFEAWAVWAIEAADRIDPVLSGLYAGLQRKDAESGG